MTRRQGMSLTEVLVALFVMALGLLAILTLFPLGALQMAKAIQDSRAAQAARNAEAIAQFQLIRNNTAYYNPNAGANARDYYVAPPGFPRLDPNNYDGPSYPLFIDPIGLRNAFPTRFGNAMPRVQPEFITSNALAYRWFSLLDDIEFGSNGIPVRPGTLIRRDNRYTWAYMVRRPSAVDHAVFTVTVIIYAGRPLVPSASEPTFPATGTARNNILSIPNASAPIRKGTWLMDVTQDGSLASVHADCYRVVNVVPQANGLLVETQTSLRASCSQVVVLVGAVEVFEKGAGWQ